MVQIKNIDAINALRRGATILNSEEAPIELGKTVVPILDGTPDFHRKIQVIANNGTNGTSANVYTTSTTKDFYLTDATLYLVKDATGTCTSSTLTGTINGVSTIIMIIPSITLTAQQSSVSMNFSNPIKIDRGTVITITNSSGVNALYGIIYGYEVDFN